MLRRLPVLAFGAILLWSVSALAQQPRPVRVQSVEFVPQERAATYTGTIQARILANLGFRIGGKIVSRPVNLGDRVAAGQVLARLDPTDLRLALQAEEQAVAAAEADANNARVEFQRYQAIGARSPAYQPSESDRRQAAMTMARARLTRLQIQLAMAHDQLGYSELCADADGVVTDLPAEVGQVVAPGQTVASVAHTSEIEVAADVPENRVSDLRLATNVSVALWSAPDRPLRGRLRTVGALADASSRTFPVRISLIDPPAESQPALGMTALVRVTYREGPPVALLPAAALTDRAGDPAVWILNPAADRASLRPVKITRFMGDGTVAVTEGLTGGEQVVTAGSALLDETMPVVAWTGTVR